MLEKLNKMFRDRYDNIFRELNKNVTYAASVESTYEVPTVEVGSSGGTLAIGQDAFSLNPPANVAIKFARKYGASAVYRLNISISECEVALRQPEYFNYLFDQIMAKAIANYNATFGGPDKLRFGDSYCQGRLLASEDPAYIELRFTGTWASDKDVPVVTAEKEGA